MQSNLALLSFLLYFYKNCSSEDKSFLIPCISLVTLKLCLHMGHIHTSWNRLAHLYFQVHGLYMSETSVKGETISSLPHKPIRGRYLRVQSNLLISKAQNTRALVFKSTSKLLIRLVTRQYCFKLQENFPLHIPFIMEYVVHRLEDAIFFIFSEVLEILEKFFFRWCPG